VLVRSCLAPMRRPARRAACARCSSRRPIVRRRDWPIAGARSVLGSADSAAATTVASAGRVAAITGRPAGYGDGAQACRGLRRPLLKTPRRASLANNSNRQGSQRIPRPRLPADTTELHSSTTRTPPPTDNMCWAACAVAAAGPSRPRSWLRTLVGARDGRDRRSEPRMARSRGLDCVGDEHDAGACQR